MTPMALSLADFDYVRTLVQEHSAVVLERDKLYLAEARLGSLARQEGHLSAEHLVAQLRVLPENGLQRKVVEAMTTNETSFFRDVHPFEALRKVLIPELLARRAKERTLRIWSAACSSGQEPYSIALLLREHFPQLQTWKVTLLASDYCTDVLQRARQGTFSQLDVNRGLPARLLVKHFQQHGRNWQINEEIRRSIEFRQLNLVSPWSALGSFDIVFLRNCLIYFSLATKQAILAKVRQILRPGGCLFLGGAETTLNVDDAFERSPVDRAVCYRLIQRSGS
jgi:chemotaxis protein methyltransferase CheR